MKNALPWIVLSAVLGLGLLYQIFGNKNELKTAYVTNAKLYAEFQMSKDLTNKLQQVQLARKNILDSLTMRLTLLEKKLVENKASKEEANEFDNLRNEYTLKNQQFVEDNNMVSQQYQEQIANQLNQYLKDFTEQNGYDYVFGATGDGSLMGAKDVYNITDMVLSYANQRYKGVAK